MLMIILFSIYMVVSLAIGLFIYFHTMKDLSGFSSKLAALYQLRDDAITFEEKCYWRDEIVAFTEKEKMSEEILDLERYLDRKYLVTATSLYVGALWLPLAVKHLVLSRK